MKQIKSHFEKIKKKVGWFCSSWKEVSSIYVSGQNEVQLIDKAQKIYEDTYKDGQFMFMYCWKVLCDQPKWHAYLDDLEKSKKRKFDDGGNVGEHLPSTNNDDDDLKRPLGTKAAKVHRKGKDKEKVKDCILELEDELHTFLDARKTTKEDRTELLETQKRVLSEKVEAKRLTHLAAVENKKAAMLETYRSLMMLDTSGMKDDVRSEHVLALKCMRSCLQKQIEVNTVSDYVLK